MQVVICPRIYRPGSHCTTRNIEKLPLCFRNILIIFLKSLTDKFSFKEYKRINIASFHRLESVILFIEFETLLSKMYSEFMDKFKFSFEFLVPTSSSTTRCRSFSLLYIFWTLVNSWNSDAIKAECHFLNLAMPDVEFCCVLICCCKSSISSLKSRE